LNRPTIVEIDLRALDFNLKILKKTVNSAKFYPVIKADAYGHGVKKVSKRISSKVDGFCVATTEEAINLRSFSKKPILDLEGPYDLSDINSLVKNNIQFVIHSSRQLNFLKKVETFQRNLPIWLKFDLGMNRLGFPMDDALKVFEEVAKKTNQIILMSHFFSFKGNNQQLKKFERLEKKLSSNKTFIQKSLCNSGGMINFPSSQKDIVRPGICLFGSKSNLKTKNLKLKPVMTLKSKFISIKEIERGEKVGYEGTWQAKRRTKIGVLPIGYGDGYPLNLSNCGKIYINGKLASVIGKISMDMMAVDLTNFRKISYKDEVILWGKGHEVDTVAKYANNSSYSLMTGISQRVKKVYKL
tara:strand:- start:7894 stop:8961 length:1068 start_codon:yes stop_codon:yes gene_type:complete